MKKIILMFVWIAAVLSFSSCSETWDDNPRLLTHEGVITDNFLNEPVLQEQYILLTRENQDASLHLTCSQPNMGYAAIVTYKVQVSLTEDFSEYEEITQAFYDCANINPVNKDMAAAIEKLSGVTTEEDLPLDYMRIYLRLRAYIETSESNTQFLSNVVYYEHIGIAENYLAIWIPDQPVNIYLRGSFDEGWNALPEYQFVTGKDENTWVIKEFTLAAGTEFKVADSTWGPLNLGAGDSNTVSVGKPFALAGGDNPGNLTINEDFTGLIQLKLEAGVYYLTLEPAN